MLYETPYANKLRIIIEYTNDLDIIMQHIQDIFDESLSFEPHQYKFLFHVVFSSCHDETLLGKLIDKFSELLIPITYNNSCYIKTKYLLINGRFKLFDKLYRNGFIPEGSILEMFFTNNNNLDLIDKFWDKCKIRYMYVYLISALECNADKLIKYLVESKNIFQSKITDQYQRRLTTLLIEDIKYAQYFIEQGYGIYSDMEFIVTTSIDRNKYDYLKLIIRVMECDPIYINKSKIEEIVEKKDLSIVYLLIQYDLLNSISLSNLLYRCVSNSWVEPVNLILNKINLRSWEFGRLLKKTNKKTDEKKMKIHQMLLQKQAAI